MTAVDLTAATLPAGTTAEQLSALVSGTNALVYVSDGSLLGTNIVSNGYCENLSLLDKTDFAPMEGSLVAGSATITRKLYAGLNTVCVPVDLRVINIPVEGTKLYTFSGVDGSTITFSETTSVAAGTPCIVELPATTVTADYQLTFTDMIMAAITPVNTDKIIGSYTNKDIGEGFYKLDLDDVFVKTTATSTIKAFRFYLNLGDAASNTFKLSLSSDDPTGIDSNEQRMENRGQYTIYSADGTKRSTLQKGLNIIRYNNGSSQKILIK